jgi:hypothetical protein
MPKDYANKGAIVRVLSLERMRNDDNVHTSCPLQNEASAPRTERVVDWRPRGHSPITAQRRMQ